MPSAHLLTVVILASLVFILAVMPYPAAAQDGQALPGEGYEAVSMPGTGQDEGNISVDVQRIDSQSSVFTVLVMAMSFVALLLVFFVLLRHVLIEQKKKRALKEKVEGMDRDEADYYRDNIDEMESGNAALDHEGDMEKDKDMEKYLKEDEKKVVSILRKKGGICSQSTLRIAGDFSKASLSRLLTELEERNVVKKEKRGKKNLVILK
ncbi:MAG: hypothetical protein R6U32_01895 [Candidatus Woesearchaeota archaeon]